MTVPIATSPGRSGFGPQLNLTYDSGTGNGVFGFGWTLSAPSISRKTDKGLPQYLDGQESDVFILSGAEDLVPVLNADLTRFEDTQTAPGFTIHRYRPRIEGLFARIERWTGAGGDVHWRSYTKDNVLTVYGATPGSRVADPKGTPGLPQRVFSWLICETRDDKGNAVAYEYAGENGDGVDVQQAHQRNRGPTNDPRRTANRYLKRIRYGNRTPMLDPSGRRPASLTQAQLDGADWMFEVVLDYDEGHVTEETTDDEGRRFLDATVEATRAWSVRGDAFSSYRAGFEVRTARLCHRVLMFHHFEDEPEVGRGCLVRSTDFSYVQQPDPTGTASPSYTFLGSITQCGYRRSGAAYLKRGLPPLEFTYTLPTVQVSVEEVDAESLENLPAGPQPPIYQWVDLHGEGLAGILTEQAGGWFYKRNLSPLADGGLKFSPGEVVRTRPNVGLAEGQFMDLAGDGLPDLVVFDGPTAGLYEHDDAESWQPFRPFTARLQRTLRDPGLRFVDLDGDGHADVLVPDGDTLTWHPSLAEDGFAAARRTPQALDEEDGPQVDFVSEADSVYLADLSGDGLTDLVRIRNGEVCYWPNLGYGRFGAKVTMDAAPLFDAPDQFDPRRLRLADIDGTGTTDLIYLHRDGVRLYFNQSGNGWSPAHTLPGAPAIDDLTTVTVSDVLGNGTACLLWSSPLPGDARRPLRYVALMGNQKPHLLVGTTNNLGAETVVRYVPSTRFYLQDRRDGRPWITRLPFPVHVVERVETYDRVSGNRFVSRYAYHHGYFDGEEREFRGFGMVEQWDTEEIGAVTVSAGTFGDAEMNAASRVPPVLTRTWFHTGLYLSRDRVSSYFARGRDGIGAGEYYREPGWSPADAERHLLPDTVLPAGLTIDEEPEACRALKGSMLRQEVYGLDGTEAAAHPYLVTEQNFTVEVLQPRAGNRHGVFFAHSRESLGYHYERNPDDPRVSHQLTLEVDPFGNVRKSLAIGYGRRPGSSPLQGEDQTKQEQSLLTYTETDYTDDDLSAPADWVGAYRTPLPCESRTYQVTGLEPPVGAIRLSFDDLVSNDYAALAGLPAFPFEQPPDPHIPGRRLIERNRTLYRRDDLTDLLRLGRHASLGLPGESYRLAFTPGLLDAVYRRAGQPLLPAPADVLGGQGADQGGYVDLDGDGHWWIPSGRVFYSPTTADDAETERNFALRHFFLVHRHRDAYGQFTVLSYDSDEQQPQRNHNLLLVETEDAVGNIVVAENDYRVLQPRRLTDPNGNRSQVLFDALGMVVATAVSGKAAPAPVEGDSLDGVVNDLPQQDIQQYFAATDPRPLATGYLGTATTRILYDLDQVPACAAAILRETHVSDLEAGSPTKLQLSFSYSDGFGREVQKKAQAEPGPVPRRDASGAIVVGADGRPEMVDGGGRPRWVGSGWIIYNNKGKPIRQFEPFFSDSHALDADARIGVSPWLFYDPIERVVATLHPNHTYEKVRFDPWQQATYDVNDTVVHLDGSADPLEDPDVAGFLTGLPTEEYSPTWYERRIALAAGDPERIAAEKAAVHRQTPAIAHLDALGRPFLTIAQNRFVRGGAVVEEAYPTRVELDIEGNERAVRDAVVRSGDERGRLVVRYDYDLLGKRLHQASMDAGERWMLGDANGNPIRSWDSRGFSRRLSYDGLRRPTGLLVTEDGVERLAERTVYGESQGATGNHRNRAYQVYDGAGLLTNVAFDFKGNLVESRRRLLADHRNPVDWQSNSAWADGDYGTTTTRDALNRPLAVTTPDGSVYRPGFNEANLLDSITVNLRGSRQGGAPVWTPIVTNVDYDAKGQRVRINYDNGASTTYDYEPDTLRLSRLRTTRPADPDTTASRLFVDQTVVQDLLYAYDPTGNITSIEDKALKTVFFDNQQVRPVASYTYDATYRLIEATGREHIGQTTHAADPPDGNRRDRDMAGLADFAVHPNDLDALRTYTQTYEYDGVGNLHSVRHGANSGSWTRSYDYAAASLLEPTKQNNRLTRTAIGNGASSSETYSYNDVQGHDVNGCMTSINAMGLAWDFKDQLHQVALGGGGTAYYLYDASGQRVRKVLEDQNGAPRAERIYLGGYEVYRTFGADATERETLHVMDDRQRFAIVETQTAPSADTPVLRYQLGNHLGSVAMELDAGGALISYEEYHPYGTSAFQAGRSLAEVSLKRYRYTGKERDEETGFSYHSARFYSPWLARWTSCDPLGLVEGTNAFVYARCNPLNSTDTSGTQCQPAVQSCAPPSGAADYNTFEEWVRNAPSPLSDAGVVEAWRAAHPDQIVNPQFSTANASTQLSSTDSADAAAGYRLPQTAGSSAVTVWDTAQRARYLEAIHNRSLSAVAEVEAARAAGDLEAAERSARAASAFRNTIRSETQEFLSPGGRLMSQALEGERSWTTMFNRYGGTHSFETYSEIAAASGRSSRLVTGLSTFGRYAGPIGVAVGVGVAGYEVSNAPPGEAPRVAVREAGGMVGGAAGATGGTALGTGTAMVVAGLLGLEGPPGWLVLVLGGAGGLAGGYGGSEGGRAGAGALYDAAVDESAAAYQEAERGIYQLYGVPHF